MRIDDLFSFMSGFLLAIAIAGIIVIIAFEIRKKRALAFTRRFAIISEALSSLKALSFRLSGQLRRLRHYCEDENLSEKEIKKIKNSLDSMVFILDTLSKGMMPPTEEIAMEALKGKRSSSEDRAYHDSIKFRDDVRFLRQLLEKKGIEGMGREFIKNNINTKFKDE